MNVSYQAALDGAGEKGAMERELYDRIRDGEERLRARKTALDALLEAPLRDLMLSALRLEKRLGKNLSPRRASGEPLLAPEALRASGRQRWNCDMLVALALNLGNEGNRQRVRDGYPDLDAEAVALLLGDDAAALLFAEVPPAPSSIQVESAHHAEAVRFADDLVKRSNPDYDASSRSALLRSKSGAVRFVTIFASAATLFAQRSAYLWGGARRGRFTYRQAARYEAFENVLPAVAMTLLFGLVRGLPDAEDGEEKLGRLAASQPTKLLKKCKKVRKALSQADFSCCRGSSMSAKAHGQPQKKGQL